jgi:5-methylcytosine-specific restriction protein A
VIKLPKADDFQTTLDDIFRNSMGSSIDINAGDLHRQVGGYPQPENRMPICCRVMLQNKSAGDEVIQRPDNDKMHGASLTIRFMLPR